MCDQAERYFTGNTVKQDHRKAFECLKQATNLSPQAQYLMGRMYYSGLGCELEPASAVQCYERAAKAGHEAAQFELGDCYLQGVGVAPELGRIRVDKNVGDQGICTGRAVFGSLL